MQKFADLEKLDDMLFKNDEALSGDEAVEGRPEQEFSKEDLEKLQRLVDMNAEMLSEGDMLDPIQEMKSAHFRKSLEGLSIEEQRSKIIQ